MTLVTLYQAEWCPFSSAVREVLTELGIDAVMRQVEPWPQQREQLRELAGTDQIPVMQTEDGRILRGTREIFAHLRGREPWRFAAAHRRRFADHRDARESDATGKLLEYFRDAGELESRDSVMAAQQVTSTVALVAERLTVRKYPSLDFAVRIFSSKTHLSVRADAFGI